MSHFLSKIKNTLQYSSNVDTATKTLPITESILNEQTDVVDTGDADAINSITKLDQDYSLSADFVALPIPTNDRVNVEELNKIKNTGVFTTGITDDTKTKQLDLIQQIYQDVTIGVVPPDLEKYGFAGFNISAGDDTTTGFDNLNFTEESGFTVVRDENKEATLDVNHDGYSKVYINGKYLNAKLADTLYFKGENLEFDAETNDLNQKYVVINNKYNSVESMEDVALDSPLQENELLMQQGGKLKKIDLDFITEIAPTTVYGGEF